MKKNSNKFFKSHIRTYFQTIGFLFPFHFLVRAAMSLFIHFCKTHMSQMSVDFFILKQLYQKMYYLEICIIKEIFFFLDLVSSHPHFLHKESVEEKGSQEIAVGRILKK